MTEAGPITRFLTQDHERLDRLLALETFEEFRRGILKHIGMEEMILLPAVKKLRGGEPLPIAHRLRLDHGAITALLVPAPTAKTVAALKAILDKHNELEEAEGGAYALCDQAVGAQASDLMAKLQNARDIPPAPHADGPHVMATVRRALTEAGYADIAASFE